MRPAAAPPRERYGFEGADAAMRQHGGVGYNGYGIALSPMQNDLLALGVKADGEEGYNMHEIPMVDGELPGVTSGRERGRGKPHETQVKTVGSFLLRQSIEVTDAVWGS